MAEVDLSMLAIDGREWGMAFHPPNPSGIRSTLIAAASWFGQDRMIHPFADLLERSRKPARIVVGLMSGASADSIDVAVCGKCRIRPNCG